MTKRIVSLLLAALMMGSCLTVFASAKNQSLSKLRASEKKASVYTALGDSASSGFGLPDYSRRGTLVLFGERIQDSYPDLVAKELGADVLYPYGVSGIRTTELRFLLDQHYDGDDILDGQIVTLSDGLISRGVLEQQRPNYMKAVKEADVITLDIGFDDIWMPTIACIYDIAEDGRYHGDPEKTIRQKIEEYGSAQVVLDNVLHYLIGFASNPLKWAHYWLSWERAIEKWATDFFVNYAAIVKQIYKLNPDVTVLALGCYNPCKGWGIGSGDNSIEHVIQPYYDLINAEKEKYTTLYPNYYYVDTRGTELITMKSTLPFYENVTLDDSGFNPHPTAEGHRMLADRILKTWNRIS